MEKPLIFYTLSKSFSFAYPLLNGMMNHIPKILIMLFLLLLPFTTSASEYIRSIEYTVSPDMTFNEAKANAIIGNFKQ